MEQSSENSRASWKNMDVVKTFLESCIQEISLNGRLGSSLKADSWNKVKLVLETTHGFSVTQKQMKNHYDYLKEKYQAWLSITKKTGNIYDPVTNTILMYNSEWDEYIKAHPKAKALKISPLPFPDLCTKLFEGSTTTGIHGWSPSCTYPRPVVSSVSTTIDIDTLDSVEDLVGNKNDGAPTNYPSQSSVPSERKPLGKKKKSSSSQLEIDEKMSNALDILIKNNNGPDIGECMEKLDALGWEEPLYSATISILCEGDSYRKAWMKIPEDDKLKSHNERFVVIKRRFQHSSQTVHKYFHEVLEAMMKFAKEEISSTTSDSNLHIPSSHKKLRKVFKGAIGALDGTLVHAVIPVNQQIVYRGRGKGKCYQNVLAIWVAHDARVLTEIASNPNNGFPFPPPNKYYLCDAAYPNTRGFLAPYRNIRYWLGDYHRRRAINKEEKFNHAHAQLRNVIERAYRVLKARFPILDKMAPYSIDVQRDIVIACFAVHNFIRKEHLNDDLFNQYDLPQVIFEEEGELEQELDETSGPSWTAEDSQFMNNMREELAL
uniref:Uncharacterized protein LOC104228372 n=1 Tax=Nicotiana sylvestris TaxID=4096 RepID=A0A1U7WPA1_NICSY|nr:PREDICTED: uncharacterized protein LOC104228372 [Nicotiana sylvestris]